MQGELSIASHPPQPASQQESAGGSPALDEATRSFVRRALAAGLVEIDEIKKVVMSLMAESSVFTPKRLANGLVGANILTNWQATKLLAGKSRGFYLGSYRLLRPLGKGGMGIVYLGEHHVMKRLMALKILPPEATKDQRRIARFKEEARACAQLDHENIVRAYDFSETGGKLYIVMEYVDGIDLHHVVLRDGPMEFADALDAIAQSTRGLAHAHQRGIVHRDVKPSNLLLRTDGVVKVSDLGLARIGWAGEDDEEKRRLMGTADFVAPEQAINSRSVDARADIYSLGCTLYFLLTRRSPFGGDSVAKRLAKHQTAPVPDLRTHRPDCPTGIAELTMRMMAKRPEDRPRSAEELLSQLKRLKGGAQSVGPQLQHVAPAADTDVDDSLYQATIEDTSLSSGGEVAVEVEEFDFGSLPPMDLGASAPVAPAAARQPAAKGKRTDKGRVAPTRKPVAASPVVTQTRAMKPMTAANTKDSGSGSQLVLLGVGLAVAIMALVAVIGMGVASFSKPLPQAQPKIKAVEDGKGGHVVIIRD